MSISGEDAVGDDARAAVAGLEAVALAAVLCLPLECLGVGAVSLRVGAALAVVAVDYWQRKPR